MLRFFYDLWFECDNEHGSTSSFHIGYFSSVKKVREIVDRLKDQPGFCDHPVECFQLSKFGLAVPEGVSKSGFCLYVPSYDYLEEDGWETWAVFGAFATEKEAIAELEKQKKKKEFRQHQECFECEKYVVDKNVGWREGFSSY